jgi:hypothetical protein
MPDDADCDVMVHPIGGWPKPTGGSDADWRRATITLECSCGAKATIDVLDVTSKILEWAKSWQSAHELHGQGAFPL